MDVPDEVRRDAERTGELVRKKLLEIMELQADIDTLLRGDKPTPFGSQKWEYADLEALQRLVAVTAIQFVLFEPVGRVKGRAPFSWMARHLKGDFGEEVTDETLLPRSPTTHRRYGSTWRRDHPPDR